MLYIFAKKNNHILFYHFEIYSNIKFDSMKTNSNI